MIVETRSQGKRAIVEIDKKKIRETRKDLEQVPLPFSTAACGEHDHGTTVTLRALNQSLSVPTGDALRAILVYEYGREPNFQIFVNNQKVTDEDLPGQLHEAQLSVPGYGSISVRFKVIPEGSKSPKKPGLVLRAGKVVGTPGYFGLDQDENIPRWLLKRVYGEVVADQIEDEDITSDWGAVKANSKAFQAITAVVQENVRSVLSDAHKKDIARHKARLQSDIDRRLAKLPEHRRAYARKAIDRALERFYADRSDRIGVAAELVLDAMELDDYWLVFQALDEGGRGDVAKLAEALADFGLFELSLVAQGAKKRLLFLDKMQTLIDAP
jgi:hypothetical protein